jgi:hypothetical protein
MILTNEELDGINERLDEILRAVYGTESRFHEGSALETVLLAMEHVTNKDIVYAVVPHAVQMLIDRIQRTANELQYTNPFDVHMIRSLLIGMRANMEALDVIMSL